MNSEVVAAITGAGFVIDIIQPIEIVRIAQLFLDSSQV
jgi:hypothetical protein